MILFVATLEAMSALFMTSASEQPKGIWFIRRFDFHISNRNVSEHRSALSQYI
jgi:hypothetical protein